MRKREAAQANGLDMQGRLREATDEAAGLPAMAARGWGCEVKAVLALDLATQTGFALRRKDGKVESGSLSLAMRKHENSGSRWLKLRHWLQDMHAKHEIDEVHFEDCVILSGPGQTQTARVYGGFVATVEMYCEHRQIAYHLHRIGAWKKRFTGNGAAKKPDVIAVCKQLGFNPVDSNEADALAILHVALGQCPLLTNPTPSRKAARRPAQMPQVGDPF